MTIFRKLAILAVLAALWQVGGLATLAYAATTLLPNGKQCFTIAGGAPAVAGSINMFIPATTTTKNTWQDANQVTLNTNPIQLDSQGCAIIYGVGIYRQQLFDGPVMGGLTTGNLIWDQLTTDTSAANPVISAGLSGGTASAITVTAPSFASIDGTIIQFLASQAPAAGATLTATGSGVGAISIVKDTANGPVALTGGEWATNDSVMVVYDLSGNQFHIVGAAAAISASQLNTSAFAFTAPVNLQINATAGSNLLTVAIKGNNGNDPSNANPVYVPFRDSTLANGDPVWVTINSALSISTFATGATLGSSNNVPFRFWIVLFNNSGTPVLALINCLTQSSTAVQIFPINESTLQSSTAISGAATSAGTFYTPNGTTLSSKAFRIIGYLEYSAGLATAGTYNIAPATVQLFGPGIKKPGDVVQSIYATTTTPTTTTTNSTTKANSGLSLSITPTSAVNPVRITLDGTVQANTGVNPNVSAIVQLFRGTNATPIGNMSAANSGAASTNAAATAHCFAFDSPQTASSTTYGVFVQTPTAVGAANATFLGVTQIGTNTGILTADEIQG